MSFSPSYPESRAFLSSFGGCFVFFVQNNKTSLLDRMNSFSLVVDDRLNWLGRQAAGRLTRAVIIYKEFRVKLVVACCLASFRVVDFECLSVVGKEQIGGIVPDIDE